jgi:8-oxo-dGTP pyrophosphatase MutT (NUDIX family)
MLKNTNFCNNCGKQGHQFYQCKLPITSYGIILCRDSKKGLQFLMLRRKDSYGYIDFVRGKYSPYNIFQIQNIVNEMAIYEKIKILEKPFEELWREMWVCDSNLIHYKNEELSSLKKMETLKNGIMIDECIYTLKDIVESSKTNWTETEWEFPKGRRNYKEKDLSCALREFEEETGFPANKIYIIENILPFEEIYIGTNHKPYKHKYFLAYTDEDSCFLDNFQTTEVSKLDWKTIDECLETIRPYNLEKKKLIMNINKVLQEYRLYPYIVL